MKNKLKVILIGSLIFIMPGKSMAAFGDTTACLLKDNKQAAWTFTSDDGFYESVCFYVSLFRKYGLKGTVGLVPDWVEGGSGYIRDWANVGESHGAWPEWKAFIKEGYLDVANHSNTHMFLLKDDGTELDDVKLEMEINGAKEAIERNLSDNYRCINFVYPYFKKNNIVIEKVKEQHEAARGGWGTPADYNSLTSPNFYDLRSQVLLTETSLSEMNGWVDRAIANGKWLIETWHGIGGVGWEPPSPETCESHLQYVSRKSTMMWVGTFTEVVKYLKERKHSTVQLISSTASQVLLDITDTLDDDIFDYPLTFKTEVSGAWDKAKVLQNGEAQLVSVVTERGTYCVYFDAVPDSGQVELTALKAGDAIVINSTAAYPFITAGGKSATVITASICDKDDSVANTAGNSITFSVSGAGTLVGANPVNAINGEATITLQSMTGACMATVNIRSSGLVSGKLDVPVAEGPAPR